MDPHYGVASDGSPRQSWNSATGPFVIPTGTAHVVVAPSMPCENPYLHVAMPRGREANTAYALLRAMPTRFSRCDSPLYNWRRRIPYGGILTKCARSPIENA